MKKARIIEVKDVCKVFGSKENSNTVLDNVSLNIEKGEFVVILGASGAGKSTMLNILGGMDTATSGKVFVDGENIVKYSPRNLISYRRDDIGFVFQFYNLIPNLTALENVELALQICKEPLSTVA